MQRGNLNQNQQEKMSLSEKCLRFSLVIVILFLLIYLEKAFIGESKGELYDILSFGAELAFAYIFASLIFQAIKNYIARLLFIGTLVSFLAFLLIK